MHETDFLLKHLLHAVYWFDEGLQDHLEAAGWPRMSRTKSMILINVADGVTRPSQIATNIGITRQAVSLALEELVEIGLLRVEADPGDKRAKRVSFASDGKGDEMRTDGLQSLHRIEKVLAARIGKKRYGMLKEALTENWGDPVAPD